jgi:hypothetical protein
MKLTKLFFSFLLSTMMITSYAAEKAHTSVNEIIGDLSFIHKFGHKPNKETDEVLRIQTHLEFVEELLRNKRITHLTPSQQKNRIQMLDLLHTYWNEGNFPANYDYEGRRISCFIDKEDRICAVGFLIEQTAGRKVAEEINAKFKYSNIMDMQDPLVENWIASSGLTKKECAMIQPTYGWEQNPGPDPVTYLTPYIYVQDTKKERKLKAQLDSQLVVTTIQQNEIDSLNRELTNMAFKTDSVTTEKQVQLDKITGEFNAAKDRHRLIIWIFAGILCALITWLTWSQLKLKRLAQTSR